MLWLAGLISRAGLDSNHCVSTHSMCSIRMGIALARLGKIRVATTFMWAKLSIFQLTYCSTCCVLSYLESSEHWVVGAEAACSHVVEFDKEQVERNPNVCGVFKKFAAVNPSDAEKGCHALFAKYGYTCPIHVEQVKLSELRALSKFPFLKLSSWAQWLLDTGRIWRLFCGCKSLSTMKVVLTEFWARYRALYPQHEVFGLEGLDLSVTIPYYSHQDEGRGYKHQAIWVLSVHGCLGRGTHEYIRRGKHQVDVQNMEFGCNFIGNTWSTQFLLCTMSKSVTHKCPGAMNRIVELFAEDCAKLAREGLCSKDGTIRIHMVHLSTKGDLPALAKLGSLTRTFSHVPRAASSRKASGGICHLCLAGQEANAAGQQAFPYEDFSVSPSWLGTVETVAPWAQRPSVLRGALVDPRKTAHFFSCDFWHNVHLGCGKHWVANSFVSAIERLQFWPGQSVESKFELLTTEFKSFCRQNHLSPHMDEISRATMGFPQGSACPLGQWSKGVVTTHFMKFLEWFCDKHKEEIKYDEVMTTIVFHYSLAYFSISCSWLVGYDPILFVIAPVICSTPRLGARSQ